MTENDNHTTYKNGDLGMVYYCVKDITPIIGWLMVDIKNVLDW